MRIVFIGYRCTGKTELSRHLSKMTGMPRISTDELIESITSKKISQIVHDDGWERFRELEHEVVVSLKDRHDIIIDTGGGLIEDPLAMKLLKHGSIVIWLKTDIKKIKTYLEKDNTRPPISGKDSAEEIDIIYKRRRPLYKKFSDYELDTTDWNIDELTDKIKKMVI